MVRFNDLGYLGQSAYCKVTSSQHICLSWGVAHGLWLDDPRVQLGRDLSEGQLEVGFLESREGFKPKNICQVAEKERIIDNVKINIDT